MTTVKPETVLLLGNFRPSLVIARCLGPRGHKIIVGSPAPSFVSRSRFVNEVWPHPPLAGQVDAFLESLRALLVARPDVSLVIPVSQSSIMALLPHLASIDVPVAMVDPLTVKACLDKGRMAQLAKELSVSQAPFGIVSNRDQMIDCADRIGFPCVARPCDALHYQEKAYFILSHDHLIDLFPTWPQWHKSLLLQAFAPGSRYNRYFIASEGRILRHLDIKTLRTDRSNGTGYGVEGVSVAPARILDEPSERMIHHLNYSGVGCIQFLVDFRTDAVSFLEINPRLGGNYSFTHYCGLDQISALIDHCLDRPMATWAEPFSYPAGRRYAWASGDMMGLFGALERRQVGVRGALKWMAQAARCTLRADHHLTLDWRDPGPSVRIALDVITAASEFVWIAATSAFGFARGVRKPPTPSDG